MDDAVTVTCSTVRVQPNLFGSPTAHCDYQPASKTHLLKLSNLSALQRILAFECKQRRDYYNMQGIGDWSTVDSSLEP